MKKPAAVGFFWNIRCIKNLQAPLFRANMHETVVYHNKKYMI